MKDTTRLACFLLASLASASCTTSGTTVEFYIVDGYRFSPAGAMGAVLRGNDVTEVAGHHGRLRAVAMGGDVPAAHADVRRFLGRFASSLWQ